jgi:hypothetical protein
MCRWHCIRCTYCIYCFRKIYHLVPVPFAFILWCKRSRVGNRNQPNICEYDLCWNPGILEYWDFIFVHEYQLWRQSLPDAPPSFSLTSIPYFVTYLDRAQKRLHRNKRNGRHCVWGKALKKTAIYAIVKEGWECQKQPTTSTRFVFECISFMFMYIFMFMFMIVFIFILHENGHEHGHGHRHGRTCPKRRSISLHLRKLFMNLFLCSTVIFYGIPCRTFAHGIWRK